MEVSRFEKALNIIEIILQIVLVVAISIIGSLLQKWLHIPLAEVLSV